MTRPMKAILDDCRRAICRWCCPPPNHCDLCKEAAKATGTVPFIEVRCSAADRSELLTDRVIRLTERKKGSVQAERDRCLGIANQVWRETVNVGLSGVDVAERIADKIQGD